jgi:pentatricopeptide repeat protein
MAFRQHNPNVITPPNPSVSNKKDVGVIGEKEPTVRSEFVDKENIPPSFSPPMPPSVHGFHDVEMERLVRGVNRFGLNHGSDNPSRVEGSILGLAPAYPPAVVRLTSLKKANSAAESSEPLAQHRFNRSLWNRAGSNTTQQDSIKKLDVLGRGIRSPKRIPFGNVHHGGCDSARNDVKSAEIPPPRADFASIVRCNAPQSPNTLQDQHHQHLLLKEAAPKDPSIPAAVADAIKASRECRGTTKVATVEKAELYLRHAIAEYHAGRITEAPNGSCYNNIVHGYADLKEPAKAEAILHLMWSDFQQGNEVT